MLVGESVCVYKYDCKGGCVSIGVCVYYFNGGGGDCKGRWGGIPVCVPIGVCISMIVKVGGGACP